MASLGVDAMLLLTGANCAKSEAGMAKEGPERNRGLTLITVFRGSMKVRGLK